MLGCISCCCYSRSFVERDADCISISSEKVLTCCLWYTHTHTRLTSLFSGTTQVSRYQKGKTNLDFTEARDSELQWHQLGHMQVCTSLQRDNHASTPPLSFLQAGCPSCRPANSVKALKATVYDKTVEIAMIILLTSSRLQIFQFLNCWVVRWPFVQNSAGYFTGQCNDTFAIF